MRKLTTLIIGVFLTISTYCQNKEFKVYPNGLIYSEQAMSKLGHVVDSLNLKFKTCDFNKVFYSKKQTVGHIVRLEKGNIKQARKDMENQIGLDDFLNKYSNASIERDVLIVKHKYKNYDDEDIVEVKHFDLKDEYGLSIALEDVSLYQKDLKGKWLFEYNEKSDYSEESLSAFYFPDSFHSIPVPKKYALMIGYTECLIDTTTTKLKDDLEEGWVELPKDWTSLSEKEKANLLDKMRSTRVVGFCSQDRRPREHAVNIALLSAETFKWEVFLKAHLDIMNDRFERMSDGSYAWGQRNTYIKELEELNINVTDLILGICFRVENAGSNHYYGSIGRVGRALSETKNRKEVEDAMLAAISDKELDNYNRLLFYFLFRNYNYYLKDETIKKENDNKLASTLATFPDYFSRRLKE